MTTGREIDISEPSLIGAGALRLTTFGAPAFCLSKAHKQREMEFFFMIQRLHLLLIGPAFNYLHPSFRVLPISHQLLIDSIRYVLFEFQEVVLDQPMI